MKERLAIVDLDSIAFIVAYSQFKGGNFSNFDDVKDHLRDFIDTLITRTKADKYILVHGAKEGINFRKILYPEYKSNRGELPEFFQLWGEKILDFFTELGSTGVKNIESDDALAIAWERYKDEYEIILVHNDKDMLQIPCLHWNIRKKVEDALSSVSEMEAEYNLSIQMLKGDSTDNIKGIEGIGTVKAKKILEECSTMNDMRKAVIEAYKNHYGDKWR